MMKESSFPRGGKVARILTQRMFRLFDSQRPLSSKKAVVGKCRYFTRISMTSKDTGYGRLKSKERRVSAHDYGDVRQTAEREERKDRRSGCSWP